MSGKQREVSGDLFLILLDKVHFSDTSDTSDTTFETKKNFFHFSLRMLISVLNYLFALCFMLCDNLNIK